MDLRSTDPARWRDSVSPEAEDRLVGAIDQLADFPVLDGTVTRVIAIADDPETTTADLVSLLGWALLSTTACSGTNRANDASTAFDAV